MTSTWCRHLTNPIPSRNEETNPTWTHLRLVTGIPNLKRVQKTNLTWTHLRLVTGIPNLKRVQKTNLTWTHLRLVSLNRVVDEHIPVDRHMQATSKNDIAFTELF